MTLRAAARALAWLAGGAAAAAIAIVAINARDEAPSEAHLAMATLAERKAVPPRSNAFLALLGMDAPRDEDPVAEGERIAAESYAEFELPWNERIERLKQRTSDDSPGRLRLEGPRPGDCSSIASPCLRRARFSPGNIEAQVAANALLVERYLAAIALHEFEETAHRLAFAVPYLHFQAQRLLLHRAANDAVHGRIDTALSFLERDLDFWRRVLASGPSLVMTMLALRSMQNDLALLAELVGDASMDLSPHGEVIGRMLSELRESRGFERTIASELAHAVAFLDDAFDPRHRTADAGLHERMETALNRRFLRPVATANLTAERSNGLARAARHMPQSCAQLATERPIGQDGGPRLDWVFNPYGKLMASFATSYSPYALRLCDLANEMRLLRAAHALRTAGIGGDDVERFLATRADLHDLYTARPFRWSRGARGLSFEPRGSRRLGEGGDVRAYLPV